MGAFDWLSQLFGGGGGGAASPNITNPSISQMTQGLDMFYGAPGSASLPASGGEGALSKLLNNPASLAVLLGGLGSAIAPKDSWQQNVGNLASTLGQQQQFAKWLEERYPGTEGKEEKDIAAKALGGNYNFTNEDLTGGTSRPAKQTVSGTGSNLQKPTAPSKTSSNLPEFISSTLEGATLPYEEPIGEKLFDFTKRLREAPGLMGTMLRWGPSENAGYWLSNPLERSINEETLKSLSLW